MQSRNPNLRVLATLAGYARSVIRETILGHDLPAGSKLDQNALARDLGVSITRIREALRRLEAEGLAFTSSHPQLSCIRTRKGIYVKIRSRLCTAEPPSSPRRGRDHRER